MLMYTSIAMGGPVIVFTTSNIIFVQYVAMNTPCKEKQFVQELPIIL